MSRGDWVFIISMGIFVIGVIYLLSVLLLQILGGQLCG